MKINFFKQMAFMFLEMQQWFHVTIQECETSDHSLTVTPSHFLWLYKIERLWTRWSFSAEITNKFVSWTQKCVCRRKPHNFSGAEDEKFKIKTSESSLKTKFYRLAMYKSDITFQQLLLYSHGMLYSYI